MCASLSLLLFSAHIPLDIDTSDNMCLVWNYQEVLDVLHRHKSAQVFFAGHTHCEGHIQDDLNGGMHHLVWPAILECKPGNNAYGIVTVYEDRMEVEGYGKVHSRCMDFNLSR